MELIQSVTGTVEKFALYLALFRSPALNGDNIWSAPIQIESAKDFEVVSFAVNIQIVDLFRFEGGGCNDVAQGCCLDKAGGDGLLPQWGYVFQ